MKIKSEHLEILDKGIKDLLSTLDVDWKQMYKNKGLSEKRYRWDLLWAAEHAGHINNSFVQSVLYDYLNDDHIDTALRSIVD